MAFNFSFKKGGEQIIPPKSAANSVQAEDELTEEQLEHVTNYNQYPYGIPEEFKKDFEIDLFPGKSGRKR